MLIYSYLLDTVILFGVAIVVIAASRSFRIPAIIGFLITGVVVGPYGLGLIQNPHRVEQFAELGVVFLLFQIGLEVSFKRLKSLGPYFFAAGPIQVACTICITAAVSALFGFSIAQDIFFGLVLSLSSTAIVLRVYNDRREQDATHGEVALGILLFQDILIVPYLLIVPLFGGGASASWVSIVTRLGGGVMVLALAVIAGRFVIPRLLQYLVATRVRELFVIGSLFLCFGAALLAHELGFSLALGAFLAGVLIAESDYHHQVMAETVPFRDIFNSIFFISIGMLLRIDFVLDHPIKVLVAAAVILSVKSVALMITVLPITRTPRIAILVSLGLSQIGEFSFVLIQTVKNMGIIDPQMYQVAIASSILTMALTPLLVWAAPKLADQLKFTDVSPGNGTDGISNHVIVVGYGLAGRHLSKVLKAATLPYRIVEMNGVTVKKAKLDGEPIIFGDASRQSILEHCGIKTARVIVFVIPDPLSIRRGIKLARQMNPEVVIIARTKFQSEISELKSCGANDVISEEFETSIEIFTTVLARLRIPGNIIRTQTRLLRSDDYQMLRSSTPVGQLSDNIVKALNIGTIDTFLISDKLKSSGMTIAQVDLRKNTGAGILAIVRNDVPQSNPSPDTIISAGDILVLVGSHAQMDKAFDHLSVPR